MKKRNEEETQELAELHTYCDSDLSVRDARASTAHFCYAYDKEQRDARWGREELSACFLLRALRSWPYGVPLDFKAQSAPRRLQDSKARPKRVHGRTPPRRRIRF